MVGGGGAADVAALADQLGLATLSDALPGRPRRYDGLRRESRTAALVGSFTRRGHRRRLDNPHQQCRRPVKLRIQTASPS